VPGTIEGAMPTCMTIVAAITRPRPACAPSRVSTRKPVAATARPPANTQPRRARAVTAGTTLETIISATIAGTPARPARSGARPRPSCRYCDVNRKIPYIANAATTLARRRGAEDLRAEELEVDQRIRDPQLPPQEDGAEGEPDDDGQHRHGLDAITGDLLDAVDRGQGSGDRHHDARHVDPSGARVAELRQDPRTEDEQPRHHRHIEHEDRAPPEGARGP
jgi:hypothetical protein